MIYLDTHILVWLYAGYTDKIPPKAELLIEKNDLLISPISILELQYLYEINRIQSSAQQIIDDLKIRVQLEVDNNAFHEVVKQSLKLSWTRDPFDRLIVAGAERCGVALLTKDTTILTHSPIAVWDQ